MCNLLHAQCVETVEVQCGDKLEELVASSSLSPYSDAGLQIAISVLTYGKYVYHSGANMQVFCHPDVTFLSYRKLMVVFFALAGVHMDRIRKLSAKGPSSTRYRLTYMY